MPNAAIENDRPASLPERRPFRFTLKQLLLAIVVVSLLLGVWVTFFRKVANVRPPRGTDPAPERYFGIDDDAEEVRPIAVVRGEFTKHTLIQATLWSVQRGRLQEGLSVRSICGNSNQNGTARRETLTATFVLGSRNTPDGRVFQLGTAGQGKSAGYSSGPPVSIPSTFSGAFTGTIKAGPEYVIYAEGDMKIDLSRATTRTEFLRKNPGNYLIVTAFLDESL